MNERSDDATGRAEDPATTSPGSEAQAPSGAPVASGEPAASGPPESTETAVAGRPAPTATASASAPEAEPGGSNWPSTLRDIAQKGWLVTVLAIIVALVVGSILIIVASPRVQETSAYFFSRPWDTIYAAFDAVYGAYQAMFRGAIWDFRSDTLIGQLQPLSNTLVNSVPLILAGLGLAVGFRAGLFNIGGQGQFILGSIAATYVGFAWDLPFLVHLLLAMLGGAVAGGLWAAIPGVLKARTGANEVIVTIMLNSIAGFLLAYILKSTVFGGERPSGQRSFSVAEAAEYPLLLGESFRLHAGVIVAVLAAAFVWWFLERSTWGFELRAVGVNPAAARTAGVSVPKAIVVAMVVSGALCGLGGTAPVLGTEHYLSLGVAGTYGFDAITVALLGRSRPWGTLFAGLLFGALKAGGTLMSTTVVTPLAGAPAAMPIEFILVLQSVVVLFIAAPPLVRWIFHLPDANRRRRKQTRRTRGQRLATTPNAAADDMVMVSNSSSPSSAASDAQEGKA
ncbi:putative sugar ABC transporter, permease component [Actinomycetales bacterium JB111]|nr:putative sugar ABC transporter, permease component [Actinomycetales bacterium JB111]